MNVAEKDYSATPLWKKLGIKEGARVAVIRAPEGFALRGLPAGVTITRRTPARTDVVLLFTADRADLERRFGALASRLDAAGGLWVAWPKKVSSVTTDLSFEIVQRTGLDAGLVDNKSCSIDQDWQALRFVYRLRDRLEGAR